ncbi:sulfotransferase domain-containing protein [Cytophagales bacterium LB-30]|uniref:Sulfotransferase domain-containing protein n=1 Tax=Shiella aurantiaca TaxID=3058365 RepID=A0ABT8F808_9BACT|nr:sulfotransferase domain-containing protein [Shiella aurantiaca]MDN4166612.1 sulfotransferase domain-containing protein [Shiella aurantiaca]
MRPTFICIGAQKSGTSWLYQNLAECNGISLTPIKELHYFDREEKYPSPNILSETLLIKRLLNLKWFVKSLRHLINILVKNGYFEFKWYFKYYYSNYNDKWYLSLFTDFKEISGEITPSYSILEQGDIIKIKNLLGDIKIIFLVRNPVDRAWSSYKYKYKIDSFDLTDIEHFKNFLFSDEQLLRSDISRTISNYQSVFKEGCILIGFYDAIIDSPKNLLNEIVAFISGNTYAFKDFRYTNEKVNKSSSLNMPREIEKILIDFYKPMINDLSHRYGGYFSKWRDELDNRNFLGDVSSTIII